MINGNKVDNVHYFLKNCENEHRIMCLLFFRSFIYLIKNVVINVIPKSSKSENNGCSKFETREFATSSGDSQVPVFIASRFSSHQRSPWIRKNYFLSRVYLQDQG